MKYAAVILLALGVFSLSSCIVLFAANTNKLVSVTSRYNDLVPFERGDKLGYVNSETFEIVIPEQYFSANHFVGGFAVVEKREGRPFVINRENKKVLGGYDHVALFDTENREFVFALVGSNSSYQAHSYGSGMDTRYTRNEPTAVNYQLYNLNTKRMVAALGRGDEFSQQVIKIFGNYLFFYMANRDDIFYKDVYEIQSDGSVIKSAMSIEELITLLVTENNLQYNETKVEYNGDYIYKRRWEYRWFGYFNKLDINRLNEQIPDGMKVQNIKIIGDFTYPLIDKQLFDIKLLEEKKYKSYEGLYNAIENRWEIPPQYDGREFSYGANDDWIILRSWMGSYDGHIFFNLITRKKSINQFLVMSTTWAKSPMVYRGYDKWARAPIIEDF